ncbi:LysR family transcriptional regulator [Pseudomonas tolaasii]|uniref:LysR family transcriptional regulator n=2 Tax=Pseudomonas tolaasii TaxID=29442 RepID=A0A7Y8AU56_PSETO|nr:LysR substrate-binding domain-containing protein [Pseudomonas tolaasii]ARB26653.1 LysR family transcriptional regulator [Pseudomonas tolaasii]KAB0470543.1 LysR family transcriptional regulator [Pseudomonas tolaasii]MBY8944003.1 LysR family transcriptional regulator [Pseudomonas tolaasii]NVZ45346.1 LysR family transcriptional regulator [Pseudomonas tolaasii]NWA48674.1 LysR family transcriptional regulator [Pseudomonas tolaasii]
MRFDLTDLRLFLAVAEQGSLTKGAEAMNLAIASVSQRISGMESLLGALLLERNSRGVTTTAAGDALVRHARLILAQVDQMRGELRSYGAGLKGRIRLLSNTAGLAAFLPRRLSSFLVAHPDLSVDLYERPSTEIVRAILEGRADLGVVTYTAGLASLQTRMIKQDQLVVAVSKKHHLCKRPSLAFAEVVGEPFVGLSDAALEAYLEERATRLGLQIHYRIQLRRIEHMAMMVASGIGIAIFSRASVGDLEGFALTMVPLQDSWALRELHLCARDFSTLTPHAGLLARHLMEPKDCTSAP